MKLIIIRHGETVENKAGITHGHTHGKLNELGIKQVSKLADYLKTEKVDLVYCSDLGRCKESLASLLKFIKVRPEYTKLLRERGRGVFDGGSLDSYIKW